MAKKEILKGTYSLIIQLRKNNKIEVGKQGLIQFKRGYYVYTGSALNSLETRLKRHMSNEKKLFWHVDYLLASPNAEIKEIVYAVDDGKWECELANLISKEGEGVNNFGCSDCKCNSHLFLFHELEKPIKTCLASFKRLKLEPKMLDDLKKDMDT